MNDDGVSHMSLLPTTNPNPSPNHLNCSIQSDDDDAGCDARDDVLTGDGNDGGDGDD